MTTRIQWETTPAVFVYRPACPHCGSERYVRTKTRDAGEGCATRFCICEGCSKPFKIIVEPMPETGIAGFNPDMV